GGFKDPLPLVQAPDGIIYVGEFGAGKVTALIPQDPGCWETRAPLPVRLLDAGGTALNGKLYMVAGKTASGPQTTTYVYNPATNTWTTGPNLPGAAVENPAVVALSGKLYAFGGSTAPFSGAVTNAAVYDPGTNAWTSLAPMPTARGGAAAQVIGGKIHVAGGMGADGASLAVVEVYDPTTNTWSTAPSMSTRRDNPGSAVLDGKLFLFGGRTRNADGTTENGTLNTVESYDPATRGWTARAPMPTGRRTMMVGTLNGRAQVMGGEIRGDGGAFNENEEYDHATDTWRILTKLPTGRHGGVAGTINGVVHVVGGGPTGGGSFTDVHEAFSFTASASPSSATVSSTTLQAPADGASGAPTAPATATDGAAAPATATDGAAAPATATDGAATPVTDTDGAAAPATATDREASRSVSPTPGTSGAEADPTIDDPAGGLGFGRTSTSMEAHEGGSAVTETVTVVADDQSAQGVTLTSDADWLTVSPASGTTPLELTLTADPTGLAPGSYSATVVARADDAAYSGATLTVTLHVRSSLDGQRDRRPGHATDRPRPARGHA
ncbi:MAG TPA: kelch repeat-containing protein, partial [Nitriliruptorales bacterium]|nr:kelch repeat-containing protein [Nitriliruptorales bacterium]